MQAPHITRVARAAARRALLGSSLVRCGQGLCIGVGAALVGVVAERALGERVPLSLGVDVVWPWIVAGGAALGLAGGVGTAILERWSLTRAALELDTRLGLHDRLSSAMAVAGRANASAIDQLVLRAGEAAAVGVDPRKAIRISAGRGWLMATPLALLAVAAGFWMPALVRPGGGQTAPVLTPQALEAARAEVASLTQEAARAAGDATADPSVARELRELEAIERELASGVATDPTAPVKAAQAADKIAAALDRSAREELRRADEATSALARAASVKAPGEQGEPGVPRPDAQLREHLQNGDIEAAASALEELARTAPDLSPQDRARWAEELSSLARAMREGVEPVGETTPPATEARTSEPLRGTDGNASQGPIAPAKAPQPPRPQDPAVPSGDASPDALTNAPSDASSEPEADAKPPTDATPSEGERPKTQPPKTGEQKSTPKQPPDAKPEPEPTEASERSEQATPTEQANPNEQSKPSESAKPNEQANPGGQSGSSQRGNESGKDPAALGDPAARREGSPEQKPDAQRPGASREQPNSNSPRDPSQRIADSLDRAARELRGEKPAKTPGERQGARPQPQQGQTEKRPDAGKPEQNQTPPPTPSTQPSPATKPDGGSQPDGARAPDANQPAGEPPAPGQQPERGVPPEQGPTPPQPQSSPGEGPLPVGQPSTNPTQASPKETESKQSPSQGSPAQPRGGGESKQGSGSTPSKQPPPEGSQPSPRQGEQGTEPPPGDAGTPSGGSNTSSPPTGNPPPGDNPSPSQRPGQSNSPRGSAPDSQPAQDPAQGTPRGAPGASPGQPGGGGSLPPLPKSDEAIKDLAKQLADVAEQSRRGKQQTQDARRLREQSQRLLDEASPEERQQLERLAEEFQRELAKRDPEQRGENAPQGAEQGAQEREDNRGTSPGRRDGANQPRPEAGEGASSSQGDGSTVGGSGQRRGPVSAPRRGLTPMPTETVDARGGEGAHRGNRVIAEWLGDGATGSGSSPALERAVRDAASGVERGIEQQAVPPGYQDLVRRVFQRYTQQRQGPAPTLTPPPSSTPSTPAPPPPPPPPK